MSAQPYLRPTSALDRRTMGKYDVLCRLSTGGMSEIFLAYQKGLAGFRKVVVLKSILPDIRGEEEFVRMFLDEAKTTASFNHPHIAQVFDLDVDGDCLFLAMEFVQGCTLVEMARACRQAKEPIPIGFTLLSVRDTALALHYAHTFTDPRGRKQVVIHRDVAEKNIMVTYEGTTKLLDFGIAKALGASNGRTSVGMVKGTSGYMSPEQIRGEPLDARSDVFSLGVVLHECLTGMRLFHGKTPEEGMLSALREEIPPPSRLAPDVSPAIDAVVLKALMRERDSRYSTSLEFARAIEKAGMGQMWHPEQSGDLVLRHFTDRVTQTRALIESTQAAMGELTGELKVDKLLADMQMARENNGQEKTRYDPDKQLYPPQPSAPTPDRARPGSGVVTAPPQRKDPASRSTRPPPPVPGPPSREITVTGEAREITDPAHAPAVPTMPPPIRHSNPNGNPVLSAAPAQSVSSISGSPRESYDDDDDVGAKTIPAAMLPGGLFAPPAEVAAAHGRRPNPLPPPVPSAPQPPPPPQSALSLERSGENDETTGSAETPLRPPVERKTPKPGKSGAVTANGWETYDDEEEDDDPGVKTTIARPFDDARATNAGGGDRRLPLYIGAGVGVGLLVLVGLMFALELGPFSPPSGPQPGKKVEMIGAPKEPEKETEKEKEAAVAVVVPKPPEPVEPPVKPAAVVDEPVKPPPPVEDKKPGKKPGRVKAPRGANKPAQKPEEDETPAAPPEPKEVKPEKPTPVAPAGEASTLTLVMEPGLLVTHNGVELGTTPLFKKPMPTGKQTLKVYSSTGEARSLTIDIKPGANSARQDFDSLNK